MPNSETSPEPNVTSEPSTKVSILSLGVLSVWLAVLVSLVNHYGRIGVGVGLIFAVCTGYFLSRLPYRLIPFRNSVWSNRDLAIALVVAVLLGAAAYRIDDRKIQAISMQQLVMISGLCIWETKGIGRKISFSIFLASVIGSIVLGFYNPGAIATLISALMVFVSWPAIRHCSKQLERQRAKLEAELTPCPQCARLLAPSSQICPRCEYKRQLA